MEYFGGSLCEVWQNVTMVGSKKNTYTLWVTRSEGGAGTGGKAEPATPVHYEMMGYNTLLGSHYDKYLVDYKEYSPHVDPKVFSLPEGGYQYTHSHTHFFCLNKNLPTCSFSHVTQYTLTPSLPPSFSRRDLWIISWSRRGTPLAGQSHEGPDSHLPARSHPAPVWTLQGEVWAFLSRRAGAREEGACFCAQCSVRRDMGSWTYIYNYFLGWGVVTL